ncbi:MAG: valine--tRNA ligase [Thermoprotei archaeon]|nr:MAG: valine--tRNA ligase [Thermoprotei archaeon]
MPKRYDFRSIEPKWQKWWEERRIYAFDRSDRRRPTYSIDTPPPYPSGELHVGNALNFSYIDFVARYKRMRGYNVLFPVGWDCHGLPTEVRVEKTLGKTKREVPPEEFLRLCREYTLKWIEPMRAALKALGCSIDWSTEYVTMDPDYWRRTQLSFILMYRSGLVYRAEHPVIWCPRCETAIAEAEVEYVKVRRELHYFKFPLKGGGEVTVASTRPELLAACVALAVNPEDERYRDLPGRKAIVPIYGREIPVIADEEVEPEFGTGVVMICTYGDKVDVKWQKRHSLPVIVVIDERGRMTEKAGPLKGLTVTEARKKIVELLKREGFYVKSEEIESSIGTCWRCHTPVEIIPRKQWFVKTRALSERVLEAAREVKWVPPHAYKRLEDWVKSLDWDWVISRQRIFATPFPVWYCKKCGATIVAEPDWLPVDPRREPPRISRCPHCGSSEFVGETDVMDTWMDSSITAAVHAGWPDSMDERLFPADLQPNGYDIIRTWDYYLLVRGVALFGKPQFKVALINGMVRGTDGRMMHKSYGNYVSLMEVIEKYGADAFRLWAALGAATGSDVRFSWEGVEYARRFLTKLWNAARFVNMALRDFDPRAEVGEDEYRDVDKWIRGRLEELTRLVTERLEEFDFMGAASSLVDFTWHVFCDHYIEAVKYRIGGSRADKRAAQRTLYDVLLRLLQMLAVFTPHIAEELYQRIYAGSVGWESITTAPWPEPRPYDEKAVERGEVIIRTIAAIRRAKSEAGMPLSAELPAVDIHAPRKYAEILRRGIDDIAGTLRIREVRISEGGRGEREVPEYPEITFTLLRA